MLHVEFNVINLLVFFVGCRDSHDRWGLKPPSTTWLVGENILQEKVHMTNSNTLRKVKYKANTIHTVYHEPTDHFGC